MTFLNQTRESIMPSYTTNLVEEFYRPLLSEATLYQRVTGYFSTSGIDLYIDGLEELAKNGGKAEFIISKEISQNDYLRIKEGYSILDELRPLRMSERNERLNSQTQKKLGNLAFMIAMGRARVKVALTQKGLFHDKFGIISSDEDIVFFNGSVNETHSGIDINYESISVDVSWDKSTKVQQRISNNKDRFNRLWSNEEVGVEVIEASELAYDEIAQYQEQSSIALNNTDDSMEATVEIPENSIYFKLIKNTVIRIDNTVNDLTSNDRKLKLGSDLSKYFERDNQTIKQETTYKDIELIIDTTKKRAIKKNVFVYVSEQVEEFLIRNKYSIEQYKIMGDIYKKRVEEFPDNKKVSFELFSEIVQSEVERPLYELHLKAAYYEYEMARVANFSVPGSGKTAMILGVFAYLNRMGAAETERVSRMLVISPINAFESWKREFKAVFGNKKELKVIDCQDSEDFDYDLNLNWGISNLILVNYESLPKYAEVLKNILDNETMLIFDEVHRIKNPYGKRATKAKEISNIPKFRYVLTGTPIPNSYQDIYNFLNILYGNEYNTYFGWDVDVLKNPKIREIKEINRKIHPFFWRTNKSDLKVPKADDDIVKIISPNEEQRNLAEEIYYSETSSLAKLIRLIQASTNPALLNQSIKFSELMSYDDDGDISGISETEFNALLDSNENKNKQSVHTYLNIDSVISPKFEEGIKLVVSLVKQGKKVLVWGIFVDTIKKIAASLQKQGISVNLVYGQTDKKDRNQLIDDFRDGGVQVLVSNPQTLGESISLHQTVHDAVYFEYDFNLTFMLQSRDRIHRLGIDQNQHTRYYYLQTASEKSTSNKPGFIDENIYLRLKEKEKIMYDAIDDDTLSIEYSENEILEAIKIIDEERGRINKNNGKL